MSSKELPSPKDRFETLLNLLASRLVKVPTAFPDINTSNHRKKLLELRQLFRQMESDWDMEDFYVEGIFLITVSNDQLREALIAENRPKLEQVLKDILVYSARDFLPMEEHPGQDVEIVDLELHPHEDHDDLEVLDGAELEVDDFDFVRYDSKPEQPKLDPEQFGILLKWVKFLKKEMSWMSDTFLINGKTIRVHTKDFQDLSYNPDIQELPENFEVGGVLNLLGCPLKSFPQFFKAGTLIVTTHLLSPAAKKTIEQHEKNGLHVIWKAI